MKLAFVPQRCQDTQRDDVVRQQIMWVSSRGSVPTGVAGGDEEKGLTPQTLLDNLAGYSKYDANAVLVQRKRLRAKRAK